MKKYKVKSISGKKLQEHRLVMQFHLGRELTKGEVVHHIDNDKSNNELDNLILFPTKSAHTKYHYEKGDLKLKAGRNKKEEIDGKFLCFICNELKEKKKFLTDSAQYFGIRGICRDCYNKRKRERKS